MSEVASQGQPIVDLIVKERVVAIVRGLLPDQSMRVAATLVDAGIRALEVTYRSNQPGDVTENAAVIGRLRAEFGDRLAVGAGTVTTLGQLDAAAAAGAQFIVSPNTDAAVIAATRQKGLASLPGAMTPSEAVAAYSAGANFVKLFPAEQLGPDYLKAIRAPLADIPFLVVGGIRADNVRSFLDAGAVGAGVGGKMVSRALADAGEYDQMADAAKAILAAVNGVDGQ